jgi:hypothetical protein
MADDVQPATVEELTITREGDDRMAPRKELRKQVVTSGAWATVIYKFQELKKSKKGEEWVEKFSLVRYRKLKGSYRFQKEFAISNADHVKVIRDTFDTWLKEAEADAPAEAPAEGD